MKTLTTVLNDCETDPRAAANRARASGRKIIGFASADVPVELIDASGAFALSLSPSNCASAVTAHADQYLEPSFSPQERAIAEQWLAGKLDQIDAVIFSRGSDSSQRLYYYLCELQRRHLTRGPRPLLYDLAKIPRASSIAYSHEATRELACALNVSMERLEAAIARRNRRRQLLQTVQHARVSANTPPGTLVERIARLADCCEPDVFDAALARWLHESRRPQAGPRLLLAGSAPGDGHLHAAVEQAGGIVVAEAGDHDLERLGPQVPAGTADPLLALSSHYHALPYGSRAFVDRAAYMGERAQSARVQGVIFWLLEEEEALVWDLPHQLQLLRSLNIPALALTRQPSTLSERALTDIRTFIAHLQVSA